MVSESVVTYIGMGYIGIITYSLTFYKLPGTSKWYIRYRCPFKTLKAPDSVIFVRLYTSCGKKIPLNQPFVKKLRNALIGKGLIWRYLEVIRLFWDKKSAKWPIYAPRDWNILFYEHIFHKFTCQIYVCRDYY